MALTIELDFDQIKQNIIDHFKAHPEFTDYNFEGSALNVLIDGLAYHAHYIAMMAHLQHSEGFLSSAQIRKNVVARAKELGYIPRSISAATATVELQITPATNPNAPITVPKGTKFSSSLDNKTFIFSTDDEYTLTDDGTGTYKGQVGLVQGFFQTQTWTYDNTIDQRFIFFQDNIDTNYISVNLLPSVGSTTVEPWYPAADLVVVAQADKVFYIQEAETSNAEIYFGDGRLSAEPTNGYIISAEYLVTEGKEANGCSAFTLTDGISGYSPSEFTVTTVDAAQNGNDKESIERIKLNAPAVFAAQNRMVQKDDYAGILLNRYSFIDAISVWGGEDAVPPQYGKIFVAIKPVSGSTLSLKDKKTITEETLEKLSVIGLVPEIVDPKYLYINLTTNAKYDATKTTLKPGELETNILTSLQNLFTTTLNSFSDTMYLSKVISAIDDTDPAILGNETTFTISQKYDVNNGYANKVLLNFLHELKSGSIYTNEWTDSTGDTHKLQDYGNGTIKWYRNGVLQFGDYGSVDYTNGTIEISDFTYMTNGIQTIEVFASTVNSDIQAKNEYVMQLGTTSITAEKV